MANRVGWSGKRLVACGVRLSGAGWAKTFTPSEELRYARCAGLCEKTLLPDELCHYSDRVPPQHTTGDGRRDAPGGTPNAVASAHPATCGQHMQIAKQLAVFLENKPWTLARMAEELAAPGSTFTPLPPATRWITRLSAWSSAIITRRCMCSANTARWWWRMTFCWWREAINPARWPNWRTNWPAAKINIEYCYWATPPRAQKGLLVLRVADPKKSLKVLSR